MTRNVFIVANNIVSPLGNTTEENFTQLTHGISGITKHYNAAFAPESFYASLFANGNDLITASDPQHTKFEQLLITSVEKALSWCTVNAADQKTALIISSTKGNVSLLETEQNNIALQKRISLPASAKLVADHFGFAADPITISNACISGIMALLTGMRLIRSGQYENAVVTGADVISKFVLSGFQSFQAISPQPCKPFDKNRSGISLGEGAGTVILSANPSSANDIKVMSGAISNDANHISAPSRTGKELSYAIKQSMDAAHLTATGIDFISAHGTATIYNDEMEAKAITLSNLQNVPVNSLKSYYGHTLGAAGLIESIISVQSLKENLFIPTLGFEETGVPDEINVPVKLLNGNFNNCLKIASGFGGCNAAMIFSKQ